MPIDGFPDRRYLIDAHGLQERIGKVTLLDVRRAEDFAVGTIEGSKHLDVYGVSLSDTSDQPLHAFLSIFQTLFGARGVSSQKSVVVFDHESGERAARVVWLLAVLGHPDVRMLDGGSQAWIRAGQKLQRLTEAPPHPDPSLAPPTAPPYKAALNLNLLATRFDVERAIEDPKTVILDVRRESEFRGTEKRAKRAGTIPGAVHVFWREHLDQHGALRPADDIRKLYLSKGVTPDKTVIAVCHGGYRSANTLLALTSLGYGDVRNYVGSWAEWGNRDDCPVSKPA